jgi:beta-galactosidase
MSLFREKLNLAGDWLLATDPEDTGVRERWFETFPAQAARSVHVPDVWDLWIPDYDGVAWYCRHFHLDPSWLEGRLEIQFDAVNYYAEVWLNGHFLGSHEGGYTPFAFDGCGKARAGENVLAVRVIDPKGPDGFGDFKPEELPIAKEMGYWSFGGIWGEVHVARMPRARITDVFIQPDLRRKRLVVEVEAEHYPEDAQVCLKVEGTPYSWTGKPGRLVLNMEKFETWSPEQPVLYLLEASLCLEDKTLDTVSTRFGMREFTVKDRRFHLNLHPLFVKGVLYQPDYARTLAGPENEAMARREIESAKAAGFNMMRLHIKPAPKIILELADELGMLLYEEPSIGWIRKSPFMSARCEQSVREMILRDRNHPSIVIWGMLNETGNAKYVTHGGAQDIKDDLCRLARGLDPTRVIIDDSAGVNATREPSRLMRPYRDIFEEYDDLHIYQRAPVDQLIRDYYAKAGEPNQLTIISEFGFGGPEDLADVLAQYGGEREHLKDARFLGKMFDACNRGFYERSLDKIFGDFSGFCAAAQQLQCDAARFQIRAMRTNDKLAGYCYTQLSDAGHEFCAGFLDRWRRPKPVMETLAESQRPLMLLVRISKSNLVPREVCEVSVTLVNDAGFTGTADLSLHIVGSTNQVMWKKKRTMKLSRNQQELWRGEISASGATGLHRFVVRLQQGLSVISQTEEIFHVYDQATTAEVDAHILDPNREYMALLSSLVRSENLLAPVHIIPPLANTIRAYPDNDLMQVLAQVKGGAIAIFFGPPEDWNDLAVLLGDELTATPKDAVGGFLPAFHYVKLHPVFDKLPSRCLMRQPYCNIVPARTFLEPGDEDICGTFDTMPVAAGNYMAGEAAWWGSDILVRPYGSGRIVMTHLRLLEHLGTDPVADRLLVNLLNHFGRRSVPPVAPLPPEQKAVEWLRLQRTHTVQRWMVLGEFPNWNSNGGFNITYPPERVIDFDAVYEGWYQPARWRRWYACAQTEYVVDFQQALEPVFQWYPKFDRAVAYAYAELTCERRVDAVMRVGFQNATRIWINNTVVFESDRQAPHDQFLRDAVSVTLRQGKNTLLVKGAKIPGAFKFSLEFSLEGQAAQIVKWWR